jgi:hypothetical protein
MEYSKLYAIEFDKDDGSLRKMRELVRCKECRHAYEHADARGRWLLCDLSTYFQVDPDEFCSLGEKEGDSDGTD